MIRTNTKLTLLNQKLNLESASHHISELVKRIQNTLQLSCLEEPVHDLDAISNPNAVAISKDIIDISDSKPLIISGKVIALYGSILVLENNGLQYMVSLKKLIGHKIRISNDIQSINFEPKQISLF
ncbi:hypothetical protein [uncultured Psychroserpens sp.]|uniref:hypothetical protein n=1 Tax=uncultured Psychroserpens sp. TaxID=255436 RepID=UPI00262FB686|nr:hypothetical protein [uncultured Psychroserpens sp.]